MSVNESITKLISEVENFLAELEKKKPRNKVVKRLLKSITSLYISFVMIEQAILRPGVIYIKNEYEELEELKKKLEKAKEEMK